jgi:hypothetical protein
MNSYLNNEVLRVEREQKKMISHGDFSGGSNRYNSSFFGGMQLHSYVDNTARRALDITRRGVAQYDALEKFEDIKTSVDRFKVERYFNDLSTSVATVINNYLQGIEQSDSGDVIKKYNELCLYLKTVINYNKLSENDRNMIIGKFNEILPQINELSDVSVIEEYDDQKQIQQLKTNIEVRNYVPIMYSNYAEKIQEKKPEYLSRKDLNSDLYHVLTSLKVTDSEKIKLEDLIEQYEKDQQSLIKTKDKDKKKYYQKRIDEFESEIKKELTIIAEQYELDMESARSATTMSSVGEPSEAPYTYAMPVDEPDEPIVPEKSVPELRRPEDVGIGEAKAPDEVERYRAALLDSLDIMAAETESDKLQSRNTSLNKQYTLNEEQIKKIKVDVGVAYKQAKKDIKDPEEFKLKSDELKDIVIAESEPYLTENKNIVDELNKNSNRIDELLKMLEDNAKAVSTISEADEKIKSAKFADIDKQIKQSKINIRKYKTVVDDLTPQRQSLINMLKSTEDKIANIDAELTKLSEKRKSIKRDLEISAKQRELTDITSDRGYMRGKSELYEVDKNFQLATKNYNNHVKILAEREAIRAGISGSGRHIFDKNMSGLKKGGINMSVIPKRKYIKKPFVVKNPYDNDPSIELFPTYDLSKYDSIIKKRN